MVVAQRNDSRPIDEEVIKFTPQPAGIERLLEQTQGGRVRMANVAFPPGVRTVWHRHPGTQILYVTEGSGRVNFANNPGLTINQGDLIYIPPMEIHWHGADPDSSMTHLAIVVGGRTEWLQEVSQEDYQDYLDQKKMS